MHGLYAFHLCSYAHCHVKTPGSRTRTRSHFFLRHGRFHYRSPRRRMDDVVSDSDDLATFELRQWLRKEQIGHVLLPLKADHPEVLSRRILLDGKDAVFSPGSLKVRVPFRVYPGRIGLGCAAFGHQVPESGYFACRSLHSLFAIYPSANPRQSGVRSSTLLSDRLPLLG